MTEAHRKCCATNTKIIDLSTSRLIHHDNNGRTRRSGFNKQLYNTPLLNRLEDIVSKQVHDNYTPGISFFRLRNRIFGYRQSYNTPGRAN